MALKRLYTIEDYRTIDPLKIWSWIYNEQIHIGSKVINMLRTDKAKGSALIFQKSKDVLLHDFATGETFAPLDYYIRLSGKPYFKALQDICSKNIQYSYSIVERDKTDITSTKRGFCKKDAEYWLSYGINSKELKSDDVNAISYFAISGTLYKAEDLAYALNLNGHVKIYQPLSTLNKWKGNVTRNDYWRFTRNSRKAVVTSSYKDGRVIFNNSRFDVFACQNERKTLPFSLLAELESYSEVLVLYDGDLAGVTNSIELCAKEGFNHVVFPEDIEIVNSYGKHVKDYAELYRHNANQLTTFMNDIYIQ